MKRITTLLFGLLAMATGLLAQDDFYNAEQIQEIRITFAADNWKYQLDSLRFNGDGLLSGLVNVNGTDYDEVGIRYRDSRSFTPNARRNGLYIDLGDERIAGHQIVNLSSGLRDPSFVREVLASEIANTYFPAPRANYAKVYINDTYYGLFINKEPLEGAFLAQFGDEEGNLARPKVEPVTNVPEGCIAQNDGTLQYQRGKTDCTITHWDALQGDLNVVEDMGGALSAKDRQTMRRALDTDGTLWMLAFNNLLVNLSSYTGQYANNYYLYKPSNRQQITPILGELNLAFGSYKNPGVGGSDLSSPQLWSLHPYLHMDNDARPLIKKLLSTDQYNKQYTAHLRTMLTEWVLSGKLENRAKALQALIREARNEDDGQYYSASEFDQSLTETIGSRSRVPGLVTFMDNRGEYLQQQGVYTNLPPEISEVDFERRVQFSSEQLSEFRIHAKITGYPTRVMVFYRFGDQGRFKRAQMQNDGQNYDGAADDDIFGAVITPPEGKTTIEYYFMAENARALNFEPSNYRFEQYRTTLAEVNK